MKIAASLKNLKLHSRTLLGNDWSKEKEAALIRECTLGFVRDTTPGGHPFGHISHDQRAHLERVDRILGTCGVEGMLLDRHGNDLSVTCSERGVALDCHYCNTGDSYGMTILYVNGRLCIGDWGSLIEALS